MCATVDKKPVISCARGSQKWQLDKSSLNLHFTIFHMPRKSGVKYAWMIKFLLFIGLYKHAFVWVAWFKSKICQYIWVETTKRVLLYLFQERICFVSKPCFLCLQLINLILLVWRIRICKLCFKQEPVIDKRQDWK